MSEDLIEKAKSFAKMKHGDTMRKTGEVFYYTHPFAVADRLSRFPALKDNKNVIVAAYLHDTVEDTDTTLEDIEREFNPEVARIVSELTSDQEKIKKGYKTDRFFKAKYLTIKINKMSPEARIIKLADREHNVSDLEKCTATFALSYSQSTEYILNHLEFNPNSIEEEIIQSIWGSIKPFL